MVLLLSQSPVPLNSATLKEWDQTVRENYPLYQREIDRTTYALQRSQRGFWLFGEWLYPTFTQHYNQNLEVYILKQQLGKINQAEIDQYKPINPQIAYHVNKTFNNKWYWPNLQDALIIGGLQAYAQLFNFQYSWRLAFLVIPYAFRVYYEFAYNNSRVPTIEFLSWATQVRKAKSQIERNTLDTTLTENYLKVFQGVNTGLVDTYNDIINLATKEQPNL